MFHLSVYLRIPYARIRPRDVEFYQREALSIVILFFWSMAGLADIIITPDIVVKTIGKLSASIFYTETGRNKAAKI